jgi:hypothetical protein
MQQHARQYSYLGGYGYTVTLPEPARRQNTCHRYTTAHLNSTEWPQWSLWSIVDCTRTGSFLK